MKALTSLVMSVGQKSLAAKAVTGKAAPAPTLIGSALKEIRGRVYVPPPATSRNALLAFENNPFVHTIVDRVASMTARQDWYLRKRSDKAKRIDEHPFLSFLRSGNELMSGLQCRKLISAHMDLAGEAFLLIGVDASGRPASYLPVPPTWVTQPAYQKSDKFLLSVPRYAQDIEIPYGNMVWIKRPRPMDPIDRGFSPTRALLTEISLHDEIATFLYSFVKNRARPDIIITGSDENPLQEADARAMEALWLQNHGGSAKAGKPLFTGSPLEVTEVGQTMADAQMEAMRKLSRDFIMQVYGAQPSLFGIIENANRATAEAADYIMARYVTEPRLKEFCEAIYPWGIQAFPDLVNYQLYYDSPIAEDKEFNLNVIRAAPSAFKKNEVRHMAGLEPVEGGDEFLKEDVGGTAGTGAGDPGKLADGNADSAKKKALTKDIDGETITQIVAAFDEGRAQFLTLLEVTMRSLAVQAAVDEAVVGAGIMIDEIEDDLNKWAADAAVTLLDQLNETSKAAIEEVLAVTPFERIAVSAAIIATFSAWLRDRLPLIATTESNRALGAVELMVGKVQKATGKMWITQRDERVRVTHVPMDGQVKAIGEPFVAGNGETAMAPGGFQSAQNNVHCLLGESATAVLGKAVKTYRRSYHGPVVTINSEDGRKLTGTPNHPVLTDRGWVPLGEVKDGDNLICCDVSGHGTVGVKNPDNHPSISEICSLAEVAFGSERIAGGAPQFHGDGRDGEVHVVSLDGELRDRFDALCAKAIGKGSLDGADVHAGLLARFGSEHPVLKAVTDATHSIVSGGSKTGSLGRIGRGHAVEHGLGSVPGCDASSGDAMANHGSGNAKVSSQSLDAGAIVVSTQKVVHVQVDEVAHDAPVEVFNLETETGAYISSGMIVSNCRCATKTYAGDPPSEGQRQVILARHQANLRRGEFLVGQGIRSLFGAQQQALLSKLGIIR